MITSANARKSMLMILCLFLGILLYRLTIHGITAAKLFAPLIVVWVVATLSVYGFTRKKDHPNA